MTVVCPGCGRRYRIPDTAAGPRRVRCSGCGQIFSSEDAIASPTGAASPGATESLPPSPASRTSISPSSGGRPKYAQSGRSAPLVLVGDEEREFRELIRRTLESLGCRVEVTSDGEAAFRFAVAHHPDLMVLNVYLQRLLGVAVCEGVKGSPDLRRTRVALVGSVFKSDRFVRHTGNIYGADDYFEDVIPEAQLRNRLAALLGRFRERPTGAGAPSAPIPAGAELDLVTPDASAGPISPNGADEPIDPHSEIHRLARIMVSDLKMYHPDEFRRAVLERRFSETFKEELTQAKDLIVRRFPTLPDRMSVLAEALKEQIAVERDAVAPRSTASAP